MKESEVKDKPVLREKAAFILLVLSASAMDSDSPVIPGLLVIISLLALSGQAA